MHKKLRAWHDTDCVFRCLDDKCCRSVNFLKALDLDLDENENKDNCELLHDAVVAGKKENLLKTEVNYDYFILYNPVRVSIYITI